MGSTEAICECSDDPRVLGRSVSQSVGRSARFLAMVFSLGGSDGSLRWFSMRAAADDQTVSGMAGQDLGVFTSFGTAIHSWEKERSWIFPLGQWLASMLLSPPPRLVIPGPGLGKGGFDRGVGVHKLLSPSLSLSWYGLSFFSISLVAFGPVIGR